MKTLIAAACLLPIAAFAQAAPSAAPAPASTAPVNCADWHKTPDGVWKSRTDTIVTYDGTQLKMHKTTVEQGQYFVKDQDVYTLLDSACGG